MDKKEREEIIKELTEKFEKIPEEETKKIWAEFEQHFTKEGVNEGINVITANGLPDLNYCGEKGLALVALGKKYGSKAVYMVKKFIKNQWVTILILLLTTSGPDQVYNNIGLWRDAGYNAVCEAIEFIGNKNYKPFFGAQSRKGTGVVFNPAWRANEDLYNRERTVVNSSNYLLNPASGTTVMSTSNVSPTVTASIDWSITSSSS